MTEDDGYVALGVAEDAPGNFTTAEHEIKAEKLLEGEGRDFLAPVPLDTRCVVRTRLLGKRPGGNLVRVTACGHYREERTDYVSVWGGDGYFHDVPVDWMEYFPVMRETDIFVVEADSPATGKSYATYHGLRASPAADMN